VNSERPHLDIERQAQAKVYSRLRRRAGLVEMGLGALYLILWMVTGAANQLGERMEAAFPEAWPLQVVLMAACLAAPWFLLSLPFGYYTGFHLPHRFGQSTQTLAGWISDLVKGMIVGAVIGLPLLVGLYAIMRRWPETWWVIAGVGYFLFTVVLLLLAPVVLMPLFNKYRPLGEDRADLVDRLMRLSASAGRRVRGVYSYDMSRRTRSANAALVGIGRTRRIILGDTLLAEFPADEIEAVLAHELGHHVHHDIPLGVLVGSALMLMEFWLVDGVLGAAVIRGALDAPADISGLPLIALVFSAIGLAIGPLLNALSRHRERRADAFSLKLTHRPQAFADAMIRLANQNLADANPPRWAVILFGTHPPLEERIRSAEGAGAPTG
jgi:STE24 endopeptidase